MWILVATQNFLSAIGPSIKKALALSINVASMAEVGLYAIVRQSWRHTSVSARVMHPQKATATYCRRPEKRKTIYFNLLIIVP